eukprot:CAMPEP_0197020952 /NCGR_PEP_ID=MMETSP1384-20130603/1819_1 /TAXON_ID=29189 /ORGANISM="Ammonia sp." /LENGTH=538 /DNA_ID=CAMNT_0042448685 /DNA_START=47 /DNA_END=1663 /DNA_ORIENTATION=-
MADHHHHHHHGGCSHDHDHDHDHHHHDHGHEEAQIKNKDNLDMPAEADIDLDAMHPELQIPKERWPLTEQELADDFAMITEDGGIKKKVLTESTAPDLGSPPKNSKVVCHYTGTLPDQNNDKFDSSRDRGEPFEFKIGAGQVIKGWDIGIASMKKGERCILRCASPYAYGPNGSPPKIPGNATLDFDVELIDWDDWDDCSGAEGQIKKRIVFAADGADADIEEDSKVNIEYRIYYKDNDVEQVLCERKNFEMVVDDDDRFTSAFHLCLKSMKERERGEFKIKDTSLINVDEIYCGDDELKQNEGNNNKCVAPQGQITYYNIKVNSQEKAPAKWNAENEERITNGTRYKEEGNALFKANRYSGAIKKYEKALEWVDRDFSDESLEKAKTELVVSCNNNLSLIAIKRKDWGEATERATKALDKDASNLKALMRRGQARMMSGFLEEAKADLKRAQSLDKENSVVKKLLKICTQKHKEYVEKQQKLYAGMFGGGKAKKKKKKKGTAAAKKAKEPMETESKDKEEEQQGDKLQVDDEQAVAV